MPVHADPTFFALSNPLSRPLHFVGLELVVIGCFVLTLRHAIGRFRDGERAPLFQWLVAFVYGIFMELIAFNYYQNYDHGQFTIQLYHRLLPLYVVCVYPVFHYTGLKLVERFALGAIAEPLVVGLAIALIDVPFDILGVDARWWIWSNADSKLAARWLGVPVTSYYWYLVFGAIYAAFCRMLRRRIEKRSLAAMGALAPLIAAATIVAGIVCFLPFHGLKALGVNDGIIVAAHGAIVAALALRGWRPGAPPLARELVAVALALISFHGVVLATLWARGLAADAPLKAAAIILASSATLGFALPIAARARAAAASRT
ncbi:MAG TPA: hypothetical protein VFF06_19570 [Polyangia bacterium]|nr:hypothetical protein [Polyangia bacterium]